MRRKLMTKKVQIILLIAITVVVLVISAFAVLDTPKYFPYNSNLLRVTDNQDGSISVQFDSKVTDYECEAYEDNYTLEAWSSKWDRMSSKKGNIMLTLPQEGTQLNQVYYSSNNGENDTLIYGNGIQNGGVMTLPRLALGYYLRLMVVLFCLLLVLRFVFKGREKIRVWIERIALYPVSYILSHLIVVGFKTISYSMQRDLGVMVILSICIYFGFLIVHNQILDAKE